jgi:2-dehydro-3-deoxyphosphogluconate aldolase/(4S)-4-hydroxy-2-oxoglutarate aldolase
MKAVEAGAKFIVSPNLNEKLAEYCDKAKLAYFPGALTPTEIEKAWSLGATMVKVFPASQMGPNYLKILKGPYEHIKLLAVGGVCSYNVSDYLSAGASAVALGGSIFTLKRMANQECFSIQKDIEEFMLAVNKNYSNIRI